MTVTFYVDQFVLYQFGMTYLILKMMEELLDSPVTLIRKVFTCLCISIASTGMILLPFQNYYVKIAGILFMEIVLFVLFSFPWMIWKKKMGIGLLSILVSFLFGSILNMLSQHNMLHRTYLTILVSIYLLYKITVFCIDKYRSQSIQSVVQVTFHLRKQIVTALAIIDSGNFLKAGKERKPVVVIEKSCLQHIRYHKTDYQIPYKTLGNPGGYLWGVECDRMQINVKGSTYQYEKVILGVYDGILAEGKYQVILPSFQELKRYQYKSLGIHCLKKGGKHNACCNEGE